MSRPKLQLALDLIDLNTAIRVANELDQWWDILEIGTALLLKEGLKSIEVFRNIFPHAIILADTKIIDSGLLLSEMACRAGADIVSVVSAASENTILNCILSAHKHGCKVLVDHLSENKHDDSLKRKTALGIDVIGFHLPKDQQGDHGFDLDYIKEFSMSSNLELSIAGGINVMKVKEMATLPIDVFVVGSYLLNAENSVENAKKLKSAILQNYKKE